MASVSQLGYFQKKRGKGINRFPRFPLYSALALLVFAIAAIVFGQTTGIGVVKNEFGNPAAIRDLVLTRGENGDVLVLDYKSGLQLAAYGENEGGFVRGSLRGLERIRFVAKIPATEPYRLIRWENGAVSLSDTATGERLYLNAFGRDNVAAFEQFLTINETKDRAAQAVGYIKGGSDK